VNPDDEENGVYDIERVGSEPPEEVWRPDSRGVESSVGWNRTKFAASRGEFGLNSPSPRADTQAFRVTRKESPIIRQMKGRMKALQKRLPQPLPPQPIRTEALEQIEHLLDCGIRIDPGRRATVEEYVPNVMPLTFQLSGELHSCCFVTPLWSRTRKEV
jgi:hypothetical protein